MERSVEYFKSAALYFMREFIPNGGDTSDTGNLEKLAFSSNACNSG